MAIFIRDGNEEYVESQEWQWEAHYFDGTVLKQYDDNGFFHQFKEIDQKKLTLFRMVSKNLSYSLVFKKGMKLIHFYENYILNDGEKRVRVYCFGYEYRGNKVIIKIYPNGGVVIE